jgi:hypothetical protein
MITTLQCIEPRARKFIVLTVAESRDTIVQTCLGASTLLNFPSKFVLVSWISRGTVTRTSWSRRTRSLLGMSHSKDGFAPARRSPKSWDEEKGPKLVFSDPTQSIFLADMVGDGLSDIVRIRYSEVCYWPNLGYGRFGAKVTMGTAPVFESPDLFDPRRIHLADIDGSGNSDIIYIGHNGISLYFNQSGNFWSLPHRLSHFPRVDSLTSIAAMDLKGNGTACLVWSSPLASDTRRPMRYIDLMGGEKPHLLVSTTNNMGAKTEVQYKASTKFYLHDREEGRPWVTKLPFPVHVIEQVKNHDLVSNTEIVSTYRYRHGYYDGVERGEIATGRRGKSLRARRGLVCVNTKAPKA